MKVLIDEDGMPYCKCSYCDEFIGPDQQVFFQDRDQDEDEQFCSEECLIGYVKFGISDETVKNLVVNDEDICPRRY